MIVYCGFPGIPFDVVVHAGTIRASLLVALQNKAKHRDFSGGNI